MDKNSIGGFSSLSNQQELVDGKAGQVKKYAFFMKKALTSDDIKDALKYSSDMLGELRAWDLEPVYYYKLYMEVFNELTHLEAYFTTQTKYTLKELYDLVQHAGNVLPRLYLMVTVGKVYIKSGGAVVTEILKDLVEMCKGVQHATRGLFLRSYLCQQFRGLLPEGKEMQGDGRSGTVLDSIDFLMVNFTEMNKLWVRMQQQGGYKDSERREKERSQLQDLVGKNLTYLSQLHGLDLELYTTMVLPRVQEQIISCKDNLAQQYLMQCVIQGFPDEFHLETLDTLLSTLPQLQSGVKIQQAMSSLMDRFADYVSQDEKSMGAFVKAGDAFSKLRKVALEVVETGDPRQMTAADAIEIYIALLKFTSSVYADNLEYVNQLLAGCYKALQGRFDKQESLSERRLMSLLEVPIEKLDVLEVLGLSEYPKLVDLLPHKRRKDMAEKIVQNLIRSQTSLDTVEHVTRLFRFVNPLVVGPVEGMDKLDIQEEQGMLARLVHLVGTPNNKELFEILEVIFTELKKGGDKKWEYTMIPLVFAGLKLVRQMSQSADTVAADYEKVLAFLEKMVYLLRDPLPVTTLRLYISLAHVASNEAKHQNYAAVFFEQAFELYEENISDSQTQLVALYSILGGLVDCYAFDEDGRAMLVQKAKTYCTTLLKKADQCRAVCASAHLFWQPLPQSGKDMNAVRDEGGVVTQLKRGIKIANSFGQQMQLVTRAGNTSPTMLFVEILNRYLYFLAQDPSPLQTDAVQNLLDLVKAEMERSKEQDADIQKLYQDTFKHISYMKMQGDDIGEKFAALIL